MPKPIILLILDGFGYRADAKHNAIKSAHTPYLDYLLQTYPNCLIATSGQSVGLPDGQMGNSEVGHMNLGAGRIVYQDFTRITKAINDGDFFTNSNLCNAIDNAVKSNKSVHIMGLLSDGGVHSHQDHIFACLKLAKMRDAKQIYIHAFLDGRDTPPQSAQNSLQQLQNICNELGTGKITSLIGRYFALDRDNRWERIEKAYNLIANGQSEYSYSNANDALLDAYKRSETDEFVKASSIGDKVKIQNGDAVIFMNFRSDRARELTQAFAEPNFTQFKRPNYLNINFVMLTNYADYLKVPCAFAQVELNDSLGEYLAKKNKTQLRISETEKYAHVTFFFSGGRELPFTGEKRILIPSPKVTTYDLQPQMSAFEITDKIVQSIAEQSFDVIIANFANCDMVGHTGNFAATKIAVETLDKCLERIINALHQTGGEALITADHGNAEQMFDENTKQPHTAHTLEPVPFIYVGSRFSHMKQNGSLSDVSPTILKLLNLPKPCAMTGDSILLDG